MEKDQPTKQTKQGDKKYFYLFFFGFLSVVVIIIAILAYPFMVGKSIKENETARREALDNCLSYNTNWYKTQMEKIGDELLDAYTLVDPYKGNVNEQLEWYQSQADTQADELEKNYNIQNTNCYQKYK